MTRSAKILKIILTIFYIAFFTTVAIFGFGLIAKVWISWKKGQQDWVGYVFVIIGAFLLIAALTVSRQMYRSFSNYVDNFLTRKIHEEKPQIKVVAKAGCIEKVLLLALIALCLSLCGTGFGQYVFLLRQKTFLHLLKVHQTTGALFILILIVYLFFLIRRHYDLKTGLITALSPVFFVMLLISTIPVLLALTFPIVALLFVIILAILRRTGDERNARTTAAAIFLYGFVLTALMGFCAVINPIPMRFMLYYRIVHAWTAPWAILLPAYFYFNLLASKRNGRFEWKIVRGTIVVLLLGVAVGASLRSIKNWELQKARMANTYPTPRLANETGLKFRNIPDKAISEDRLCSFCHPLTYRQWARSTHAFAAKTLSFQKIVTALIQRHGSEIARECAACHDPEVALSKDPRILVDPKHIKRSQGISCRTCHYMILSGGKNALYAIALPRSDLIVGSATMPNSTLKIRQIYADTNTGNLIARADYIISSVLEHIGDVSRPIIKNGSVCFPCHSLESIRNGHKKIPLDNVSSFLSSKLGKDISCHRCHMQRIGRDKDGYSWLDHSFFGIQQELPEVAIFPGTVKKGELETFTKDTGKFLSGNLPVLETLQAYPNEPPRLNAAKLIREINKSRKVALGGSHFTMAVEKEAIRGSKLFLTLSTLNRNVSHDFPSSLFANIVEVWFELEVDDASGRKLYFSGYDNNDYSHRLGRIEVDERGLPIVPADSLRYVEIVNKKFLHPGKKYFETYSIPIKPQIRFPLKAKYRLMYRRYSKDFAVWMSDGAIQSFPARVIAEKEFVIAEKPGRR